MSVEKSGAATRYMVREGEFIKWGYTEVEQEFAKASALWELGCRAGFVAPRVKHCDRTDASITYELLPQLISIREPYLAFMTARTEPASVPQVLERSGTMLARIHAGLRLPQATRWQPSAQFARVFATVSNDLQWLQRVPWAVAHCDYGFANVQTLGPDGCIAIIDPSANGFVTFSSALHAPIYVDIANFVTCLEGLVPPRNFPRMRWDALPRVREAFLGAYERESGLQLERALIAQLSYATAHCYFNRKFRYPIVPRLALNVLFNRFKHNRIGRSA